MELFTIKKDIPFMRYAVAFNAVSISLFFAALFFLITHGLHLSIEFTGGTVMELAFAKAAEVEKIRQSITVLGYPDNQVQNFGTAQEVLIRLPAQTRVDIKTQAARVLDVLKKHDPDVVLKRTEFVGPQVGGELARDGLFALAFVVIGIMIYLAIRFEWKYAIAAIIANLHDVIIILGFFAFFQWEFSLTVLAALLAVLGYSVNESVVVFDRVRETFRHGVLGKMPTAEVLNHAITHTMSRTIITHGSTQLMVLAMLFLGGATLHYFCLALTIGILFGIYSSVFVAATIAMWLGVKRKDLLVPVKAKLENEGAVV